MDNITLIEKIKESEKKLRLAMLHSDVTTLNELLAPDLIFTNHLGQLITKQDDLDAHQSGMLKIKKITTSEQQIQLIENVAIVSVRVNIIGSFAGTTSKSDFRFTRVWAKNVNGAWNVVAAHSSLVS